MNQAKWIWYPGDFEIYHSNLVHSRREDYGIDYPPFWIQSTPYPCLSFIKKATVESSHSTVIHSTCYGMAILDGKRLPLNEEINLPAGEHELRVSLFGVSGLPAIFIDDQDFATNESWTVSCGLAGTPENGWQASEIYAAGTPAYTTAEVTPEVFPFSYESIFPVNVQKTSGGKLYDFGRESFGPVHITGANPEDTIFVCYGESREEALDFKRAILKQTVTGADRYDLVPRAFRYIYVRADFSPDCTLSAQYEFLPLQDVADFSCNDPLVKKIWDTCAYTFHLNSREFYQDGIKRDRWVWAGDSYQSFMINNYLYFDPEITKRTIRALLGKPPYQQHINTINDYTLYLIISVQDYYQATGDIAFVKEVWPRIKTLFDFVRSRLNEDGLMVQRPGDWIFIDWSPMDKEGPICAEQILLWKALHAMADLAALCGADAAVYNNQADTLHATVETRFWSADKQAYIDGFISGKNNVTRHANIFAILYDFVDAETQQVLRKNVLENDEITQITTPYFKFFELCARCKLGDLISSQKLLTSYWGGMLKDGATSIWEQYDPNATGTEHYAMYGDTYGCSLCHAWGSGPLYLLGRYCLGVCSTSVAYRTFTVAPKAGLYSEIHGIAPIYGGNVRVDYSDGILRVLASKDGGTLEVNGKSYLLEAGKPFELACTL